MTTDRERIEQGKVLGRFIIEILGAPKEHIEKTLREYVQKLKEDTDLEVVKEEYAPAEPRDKLFTAFVELEIWLKDIYKLIEFCFDAMPSSVEIIEPESFNIKSNQLSGLLNDLQARIHAVDMALKKLKAYNKWLEKNSNTLVRNIVLLALKDKSKSLKELSTSVGIVEAQLKRITEKLEKEGLIVSNGERFAIRGKEYVTETQP